MGHRRPPSAKGACEGLQGPWSLQKDVVLIELTVCFGMQHSITIVSVQLDFRQGHVDTDATGYKVRIPIGLPVDGSSVSQEIFSIRTQQLISILSSCLGPSRQRMRASVHTGAPFTWTRVNVTVFLSYAKSSRQQRQISSMVRLLSNPASSLHRRVYSTMLHAVQRWPEYNGTHGELLISPSVLTVPPPVFSSVYQPHSPTLGRQLLQSKTHPAQDLSTQGNATMKFFVRSHPDIVSSDDVLRSILLSANTTSVFPARMSVFSMYRSHYDYCRHSETHNLQNIRTMLLPIVKQASHDRIKDLDPVSMSPMRYKSCAVPSRRSTPDSDRVPFSIEIALYAKSEGDAWLSQSPLITEAGVFAMTFLPTKHKTGWQVQAATLPLDSSSATLSSDVQVTTTYPATRNILTISVLSAVAAIACLLGISCSGASFFHATRVVQPPMYPFPGHYHYLASAAEA